MQIKMRYFGIPMGNLGRETRLLDLSADATVEQLFQLIATKLGDRDKELLSGATFMVNKARAERRTALKDGDEVLIFCSLAGG